MADLQQTLTQFLEEHEALKQRVEDLGLRIMQREPADSDSYHYPLWVFRQNGTFVCEAISYTAYDKACYTARGNLVTGLWHAAEASGLGDLEARNTDYWVPVHVVRDYIGRKHVQTLSSKNDTAS